MHTHCTIHSSNCTTRPENTRNIEIRNTQGAGGGVLFHVKENMYLCIVYVLLYH